jgi:predicted nucleotidyltransferase
MKFPEEFKEFIEVLNGENGDDLVDELFLKRIEHALIKAKLPFRLIAAILFGSRVKNKQTQESDLDLLIVADGVNQKFHRRGEQIALIKKNLPPLSFDILLCTESEVLSNFRNHNPLFLDIAEEGKLLFDKAGFLENLIRETKAYIRKRGIKKLEDGWAFPVRPGIPTLLSKISN